MELEGEAGASSGRPDGSVSRASFLQTMGSHRHVLSKVVTWLQLLVKNDHCSCSVGTKLKRVGRRARVMGKGHGLGL